VTNPYREVWPWVRLALLVGAGALLLYLLGRWDASLDAQQAALERETATVLAVSGTLRAHRDSLRQIEDSLAAVDRELARHERTADSALAALRRLAQIEVDSVALAPLADLLPPLRLHPVHVGDQQLYATDSAGVRVLAGRLLRVDQLERENTALGTLADARALRLEALSRQVLAATLRADTAEARIGVLEPLLARWEASRQCKILWLVPCPSRTTALVVGIGVGVAGTLIAGGL
jgi:hypothetical protein